MGHYLAVRERAHRLSVKPDKPKPPSFLHLLRCRLAVCSTLVEVSSAAPATLSGRKAESHTRGGRDTVVPPIVLRWRWQTRRKYDIHGGSVFPCRLDRISQDGGPFVWRSNAVNRNISWALSFAPVLDPVQPGRKVGTRGRDSCTRQIPASKIPVRPMTTFVDNMGLLLGEADASIPETQTDNALTIGHVHSSQAPIRISRIDSGLWPCASGRWWGGHPLPLAN
jgi:hypothetical protein